MAKAKVEFLWYKKGEEIKEADKENIKAWAKDGLVEEEKKEVPKSENKSSQKKSLFGKK